VGAGGGSSEPWTEDGVEGRVDANRVAAEKARAQAGSSDYTRVTMKME
jgi:hypothetical protein